MGPASDQREESVSEDRWFATRLLERGIHLISEPIHVNSFLIEGPDLALLVDSGRGIGNIEAVVRRLTPNPTSVVNTHYHYDHSGGNRLFADIAIHELGAVPLSQPVARPLLSRYVNFTRDMLAQLQTFVELDEQFFHFLSDDTMPREFPEGFDPEAWEITPSVPTRLLREGDNVDLGSRSLEVLHTPGHTPDSICLLDETNGVLFGGDTINTGPIYAQLPDSDLKAFAASTRRLAELASQVRVVYMAHFVRYAEGGQYLHEVAEGFEQAAADDVEWRRGVDVLGFHVKEARFPRFSILIPDPEAGEVTPLLHGPA